MSAAFTFDDHKPLPSPGRSDRFDKLPPPPPSDAADDAYIPPLPPKIVHDLDVDPSGSLGLLPPIPTLPSLGSLDHTLNVPLTPTTPTSPTSSSGPSSPSVDGKSKKSNPLIDLIETEKLYVDQLTGIIRKVAAAWSRNNLPPKELDVMFRSVEMVYKANRSLLSRLKEIGTNPSSPKALGDLLMRWIDDLEVPYTTYCDRYCSGFDIWEPIANNSRLPKVLANFSASNPPPMSAVLPPDNGDPPVWNLDALFLLPKGRLKYYRKLYSRLLKSTTPGRSDHKLLLGALDKLDTLMSTLESRGTIQVGSSDFTQKSPPALEQTEDEVVIDLRTQSVIGKTLDLAPSPGAPSSGAHSPLKDNTVASASSSTHASSRSSGERFSQQTTSTSISRASTQTLSRPISDLERRLSTDRTLDIFTMKPKAVRLQMAPPTLTFLREMKFTTDVQIRLTPRATGEEVVHRQGHVFILSDLFLVCERMTSEEQAQFGADGPDMWLLYPPLAGKVLRVSEADEDNSINVVIMRKETLVLTAESQSLRDTMFAEFKECIAFASSLPPPSKEAPPPLPPLPGMGMQRSPSAPLPSPSPNTATSSDTPPMPSRDSGGVSPYDPRSSQRSSSGPPRSSSSGPPSARQSNSSDQVVFPPRRFDSRNQGSSPQTSGFSSPNLVLSPEAQAQEGRGRVPSLHDPMPGPMYPLRKSSSATVQAFPGQNPSFQPGQVMPPARQASVGSVQDPSRPPHNQALGPPGRGYGPPPQGYGPNSPPRQGYGPPQSMGRGQPMGFQQPPPQSAPGHVQFAPPPGPYGPGPMRNSPSSRSLGSQYDQGPPGRQPPLPPMPPGGGRGMPPGGPGGYPPGQRPPPGRTNSFGSASTPLAAPQPRTLLPSMQMNVRSDSAANNMSFVDPSPPNSPVEESRPNLGPVTTTVSAQMKCKVFLKREHAQWKSLGSAKLKLYREDPTNVKQLVVEADDRHKSVLISTIVLTDGVERVGKTGVAVELSDKGARTGIVYMIQLRNEESAGGFFDSLLAGSDRAGRP